MPPRSPDRSRTARQRLVVPVALALALTAAACGGTSTSPGDSLNTAPAEGAAAQEAPAETAAAAGSAENQLPQVDVVDLATGDQVNLSSFAPSATPIVLWFWAPH